MKMCPACDVPICDFCKDYDFNGEPHTGLDGSVAMVYVGKGHCRKHERPKEPHGGCDDFECRKYVEPKGEKEIDDLPSDEWIDQMMREVGE